MRNLTRKQLFVRIVLGGPFIPLQFFLRGLTKLGEVADDLDYEVSKFILTKIIRPIEKKLKEGE